MVETRKSQPTTQRQNVAGFARQKGYDTWIESTGLPIHRGYYVEDLRTLEPGWWADRKCSAAFLQLEGQQGVSEARVSEIPPGKTLPPLMFALDELVYVVEGRGLTTVWRDGGEKQTFEWQKHSLFLLPRHHYHQFSNTQGDKPVRLLHNSYLPVAMAGVPDPGFYFNHGAPEGFPDLVSGTDRSFYSEAKVVQSSEARVRSSWHGNFFPDMNAWDKLVPFRGRGAGGTTVFFRFPGSPNGAHMSVFDAGTYKKAHRHGPGFVIVIPAGEGYSVMWPQGQEKVVCPWHEGSVFVPPGQWFHQHFNSGAAPARYLALSPPQEFAGTGERVQGRSNQIEYPDEERWIRDKFESELAARGLKSRMPEEAYRDPNYEWDYSAYGDQ